MNHPISEKDRRKFLTGAIFLMATSAIGPAFLTQTARFTEQFLASFAFAILISLIIDIGVQMNIWRVISVSGKRGQEIANALLPGLGYVIAGLILFGGFAFNIANIGGAALGLNVLFDLPLTIGGLITAVLTIGLFMFKRFGPVMDRVMQVCGIIMLLMVGYVMFNSSPPVQEAAYRAIVPEGYMMLLLPIVTIVGGTVGGYISFAGGHRLVDAGITGKENVKFVGRAANLGILTTGIMRVFLFLAVLGVVTAGYSLDENNPAATVFQVGLGDIGYYLFGLVLFVAAISSVIGCAYTSVSFLRSFHPIFAKKNNLFIAGFIIISALIFLTIGQPVQLLILAGALNGLILPVVLNDHFNCFKKKIDCR